MGTQQEIRNVLAFLASFRITCYILIFSERLDDFDFETNLLAYFTNSSFLYVLALFNTSLGEGPMAENIMDQSKVDIAIVSCEYDCSTKTLHWHLLVRNIFAFLAYFVLAWLPQLLIYGAEHAVDEPAAILTSVGFSKLDRFIYSDLRRHLISIGK